MLHPSYTDLMKLVNSEVETGEAPVVNSRYSIVLATSKRARQLIDGAEAYVSSKCPKPLSVAVEELNNSKIRILSEEEAAEVEAKKLLKINGMLSDDNIDNNSNLNDISDNTEDSDLNDDNISDDNINDDNVGDDNISDENINDDNVSDIGLGDIDVSRKDIIDNNSDLEDEVV